MKIWPWLWMPAGVFLLGILSAILLLSSYHVSERQRLDWNTVTAIMEAQIATATAHLWLKHVIVGEREVTAKEVIADLDQAITLFDAILQGGHPEQGLIPVSLKDPSLRARAEELKALLIALRINALLRLQSPETSGMGSATDHNFNALFSKILGMARELEDIIKIAEAGNEEKFDRLFLTVLGIWLFIVASATTGLSILERQRKKNKMELQATNAQLQAQAEELAEHHERLEGLVTKRTAELQAAHVRMHAEMAERLQARVILHEAEKQNRNLANKLLSAQETERKRIAMELHDGLGQALNVIKLRLRVVEKGAKAGQSRREECENLMAYMDQTIEEVRRISLDLSPAVLEELGLKSALQWLLRNLEEDFNLTISADIEEIDRLFPETHGIVLYRVVQEALANIGKHAQAGNVSFLARQQGQRVVFSLEDDGKGFDPKQALAQEAAEKGLGLTTMRERVKIMGGDFELWSQKGRGTRITFSIPVTHGEA